MRQSLIVKSPRPNTITNIQHRVLEILSRRNDRRTGMSKEISPRPHIDQIRFLLLHQGSIEANEQRRLLESFSLVVQVWHERVDAPFAGWQWLVESVWVERQDTGGLSRRGVVQHVVADTGEEGDVRED